MQRFLCVPQPLFEQKSDLILAVRIGGSIRRQSQRPSSKAIRQHHRDRIRVSLPPLLAQKHADLNRIAIRNFKSLA